MESVFPAQLWGGLRRGKPEDRAQDYRDECERVEVEHRFSLAKRKCGMGWSLQSCGRLRPM